LEAIIIHVLSSLFSGKSSSSCLYSGLIQRFEFNIILMSRKKKESSESISDNNTEDNNAEEYAFGVLLVEFLENKKRISVSKLEK